MAANMQTILAALEMRDAAGSPGARELRSSPFSPALQHPQPHGTGVLQDALYSSPPLASADYGKPLSTTASPGSNPPADQANKLLELLKFNTSTKSLSRTTSAAQPIALSDDAKKDDSQSSFLSSFMRAKSYSSHTGDKPTLPDPVSVSDSAVVDQPSTGRDSTPTRVFGTRSNDPPTTFEPQTQHNKGQFTYVNPFEQLSASSPLNKSPVPGRRSGAATPKSHFTRSNNLETPTLGTGAASPSPLPGQRTQLEALMGIGMKNESVSEALDLAGEQVDKQAQDAIAKAEGAVSSLDRNKNVQEQELREAVQEAAAEMQEDLKDIDRKEALENIPEPVRKAFQEHARDAMEEPVAASWESAGAEEARPAESVSQVYSFPMRPWVAINILDEKITPHPVREDIIMKIASLKTEFDQVDRTLATATAKFIAYAFPKKGGVRIIHQDGLKTQAFKGVDNRIFNVSISAPPSSKSAPGDPEVLLATGIKGSVFWTSLSVSPDDGFAETDLDKEGLIFPPVPSHEENTSGAQIKTRAKLSSRHSDIFGVGRGKAIYLIRPSVARRAEYIDSKSRIVNSEKYLNEHTLKITGTKAGKDFAFSADDTTLVSLDKAGRLKFWDIHEHISAKNDQPNKFVCVETNTPLYTLETCSEKEKSWATSVRFVDEESPMSRGYALRYLLVGLKQNHTLQLWDLYLGQPVQELNFPHKNEDDAICSIAYHPKTNTIAVGHPTRNSVFLIPLSAPKYHLPKISQAVYIQRIASHDARLPKPESTAIMSGFREFSLASVGQLRSLDLANPPVDQESKASDGDETKLVAYIMHSGGITSLSFKAQDIGLARLSKALDAESEGVIEVCNIQLITAKAFPSGENGATPIAGESATIPVRTETTERIVTQTASIVLPVEQSQTQQSGVFDAAEPEKQTAIPLESVASMKTPEATSFASAPEAILDEPLGISSMAPTDVPVGRPLSERNASISAPETAIDVEFASQLGATISQALGSTVGDTLSKVFGQVLGDQLEVLYRRLDDDKRVSEASAAAKQDAVLRLVSSTLTDNVEKSLSRIVTTTIRQEVVPAVHEVTGHAVDRNVSNALGEQLNATMPRELRNALPPAVGHAMQSPEVLRIIADLVSSKVTQHVESVFSKALHDHIAPAYKKLSVETAQKSVSDVQARVSEQIRQFETQHRHDTAKIDQLVGITSELISTVGSLTNSQAELQKEILMLRNAIPVQQEAMSQRAVAMDKDAYAINELMSQGKYGEAIMKWLQTAERHVELFDAVLDRYNPLCLQSCNQMMILATTAAISVSFETHTAERLAWLEVALNNLDVQEDSELSKHIVGMMDTLERRLSEAYMQLSEINRGDPLLTRIHIVRRQALELRNLAG